MEPHLDGGTLESGVLDKFAKTIESGSATDGR
jgi:hypothetical protein